MNINLHPAGDPSSRGWGAGWPRCSSDKWVKVTWSNGVSPVGGVRVEIATLVDLLGDETIRRGYAPHAGWCWGGNCRPIAGTSTPSLHSWGLAVDINAPTNPRTDRLVTDMPAWMPDLWNVYGFRWGGDYPAGIQKDAMHYEFMGTPAQAAEMTAKARVDFAPKPPHPQPVPEDDMFVYYIKTGDATGAGYIRFSSGRTHVSGDEAAGRRTAGETVKGVFLPASDPFWALPVLP